MKRIKLFEELTNDECLVKKSTVIRIIKEYLSEDYFNYFGEEIASYEGEEREYDIFDAIRYYNDSDIQVNDDGVEFNGEYDLQHVIMNLLEMRSLELINEVIKNILEEKLKEEPANYIKHKDLYNSWQINIPIEIKRADNSGLLNLEK